MRLCIPSLVLVLVLGTAACATTRPVSQPDAPAASIAESGSAMVAADGRGPCLPPGVDSRFFAWPVKAFRAIVIPRDDRTTTTGAWVLYAKGASEIAAVWSGEELVALDPSPSTDTPVWLDGALIDPESTVLRARTDGHCKWQRGDERQT
jgi:hypothetical protein